MVGEMGIMSSKPRWKVAQVATVLPALALLASCMRQTEQKSADTLASTTAASGDKGFWTSPPSDVAQRRKVFSTIKPFVASELCLLPQG